MTLPNMRQLLRNIVRLSAVTAVLRRSMFEIHQDDNGGSFLNESVFPRTLFSNNFVLKHICIKDFHII